MWRWHGAPIITYSCKREWSRKHIRQMTKQTTHRTDREYQGTNPAFSQVNENFALFKGRLIRSHHICNFSSFVFTGQKQSFKFKNVYSIYSFIVLLGKISSFLESLSAYAEALSFQKERWLIYHTAITTENLTESCHLHSYLFRYKKCLK